MIKINIPGAKNGALPILCATLLTKGIYTIYNIPNINDIDSLLVLFKQCNVLIKRENSKVLLDTRNLLLPKKLEYNKDFRGSYYLIGALYYLIEDTYNFRISNGCNIDNRKINFHIDILEELNTQCKIKDYNLNIVKKKSKHKIFKYRLEKPSVGATINFILINVISRRRNYLYNYAKEPYIIDLINFLKLMGSKISLNKKYILIEGVECITSVDYSVIPDPIVMSTYILLGAITHHKYNLKLALNVFQKDILGYFYNILPTLGIQIIENENDKHFYINYSKNKIKNLKTGYFPDIFTDIQPILTLFCCETIKKKIVFIDEIYNNRFKYTKQLNRIGYNIDLINNNKIIINPSFKYRKINSIHNNDLRGDAALLIALLLSGNDIDIIEKKYIDRGYENIFEIILSIKNIIKKNENL